MRVSVFADFKLRVWVIMEKKHGKDGAEGGKEQHEYQYTAHQSILSNVWCDGGIRFFVHWLLCADARTLQTGWRVVVSSGEWLFEDGRDTAHTLHPLS
jgi:hypothetical protein